MLQLQHLYEIDILDIPLTKDKVYTLSYNSREWYYRTKTDNSVATFPITVGNIKILGSRYNFGAAQVCPSQIATNYIAGDLSFNFLRQQ